jgi:hypothetical protein
MAKVGKVANDNVVTVYPSSRISDRVIFGTGKAVNDIINKRCDGFYPIYSPHIWNIIAEISNFFNILADLVFDIENDSNFEIIQLLKKHIIQEKITKENILKSSNILTYEHVFCEKYLSYKLDTFRFTMTIDSFFILNARNWNNIMNVEELPLRVNFFEKCLKNSKTKKQFLKFCDEKFDGLKIMKSLKEMHSLKEIHDFSGKDENERIEGLFTALDNILKIIADVDIEESMEKMSTETKISIMENAKIFGITLSDNFSTEELIDMAVLRDELYRLT